MWQVSWKHNLQCTKKEEGILPLYRSLKKPVTGLYLLLKRLQICVRGLRKTGITQDFRTSIHAFHQKTGSGFIVLNAFPARENKVLLTSFAEQSPSLFL